MPQKDDDKDSILQTDQEPLPTPLDKSAPEVNRRPPDESRTEIISGRWFRSFWILGSAVGPLLFALIAYVPWPAPVPIELDVSTAVFTGQVSRMTRRQNVVHFDGNVVLNGTASLQVAKPEVSCQDFKSLTIFNVTGVLTDLELTSGTTFEASWDPETLMLRTSGPLADKNKVSSDPVKSTLRISEPAIRTMLVGNCKPDAKELSLSRGSTVSSRQAAYGQLTMTFYGSSRLGLQSLPLQELHFDWPDNNNDVGFSRFPVRDKLG